MSMYTVFALLAVLVLGHDEPVGGEIQPNADTDHEGILGASKNILQDICSKNSGSVDLADERYSALRWAFITYPVIAVVTGLSIGFLFSKCKKCEMNTKIFWALYVAFSIFPGIPLALIAYAVIRVDGLTGLATMLSADTKGEILYKDGDAPNVSGLLLLISFGVMLTSIGWFLLGLCTLAGYSRTIVIVLPTVLAIGAAAIFIMIWYLDSANRRVVEFFQKKE